MDWKAIWPIPAAIMVSLGLLVSGYNAWQKYEYLVLEKDILRCEVTSVYKSIENGTALKDNCAMEAIIERQKNL